MSDPAYGLMHKQTLQDLVKENERLQARLAEAEKALRRWEQQQVRPQEVIDRLQAAEADRDRYMEKSETLRVLYDKTCDDAERYKAACELANRYFTLEDERDRGEGGAGIYREMRAALRAAATEEPA